MTDASAYRWLWAIYTMFWEFETRKDAALTDAMLYRLKAMDAESEPRRQQFMDLADEALRKAGLLDADKPHAS